MRTARCCHVAAVAAVTAAAVQFVHMMMDDSRPALLQQEVQYGWQALPSPDKRTAD